MEELQAKGYGRHKGECRGRGRRGGGGTVVSKMGTPSPSTIYFQLGQEVIKEGGKLLNRTLNGYILPLNGE